LSTRHEVVVDHLDGNGATVEPASSSSFCAERGEHSQTRLLVSARHGSRRYTPVGDEFDIFESCR
jgi:hypothetical protein